MGDRYCRSCGVHLESSRALVAFTSQRSVIRQLPTEPAIWRGLTVVAGAVLVELLRRVLSDPERWAGFTLDLLDRRVAKTSPRKRGNGIVAKSRSRIRRDQDAEITETILLIERRIRR
jgi:hypothetical protein